MDDSPLLPPAASVSKVTELEGGAACVGNATAVKYGRKKEGGGREDKKTLRTTTKASRRWQEGLKKETERHRGRIYFYGWTEIQPA